jgi:hypothetical protein
MGPCAYSAPSACGSTTIDLWLALFLAFGGFFAFFVVLYVGQVWTHHIKRHWK